jgi:hypothetical protein
MDATLRLTVHGEEHSLTVDTCTTLSFDCREEGWLKTVLDVA